MPRFMEAYDKVRDAAHLMTLPPDCLGPQTIRRCDHLYEEGLDTLEDMGVAIGLSGMVITREEHFGGKMP